MSDVDRYKNRRRMAWISFWMINVLGTLIILLGMINDEMPRRIEGMSFILGTIFGVWVTIVLAYFGANVMTDSAEIKNGRQGAVKGRVGQG